VSLAAVRIVDDLVIDPKHDDEAWRRLEKRLAPVGPQRRQRLEPFGWSPTLVEFALFPLGGFADLLFDVGVAHDDESPGLQIGAGRRGTGDGKRLVDEHI